MLDFPTRTIQTQSAPENAGTKQLGFFHGSLGGASVSGALASLANAPRSQPARPCAGGRCIAAPRELPRDRACTAEPRDGAAPRCSARCSTARPERHVASGWISRSVLGASPGGRAVTKRLREEFAKLQVEINDEKSRSSPGSGASHRADA